MKKYNIEGSIDFFTELYKSLDDEDDEKDIEQDNLCLITNLPLNNNFFKMDCGHKFNYVPLYLDIKNHKQKFNGMEGNSSRLNKNEIRCPYCRNRHKGVLPYYEELGLPKIDGVNFVNPNYKTPVNTSSYYKTCQFLTPNPNFNPDGENASETIAGNGGNCKYFLCYHMGSKINFQYGQETAENYGDDKYYCWNHKKQMIKKYKTDIVVKAKEEAKKQKEESKKQKEEAKQKQKEDAKKQKEDAKQQIKKQKEEAKQKQKDESKQKQKEEAKQKQKDESKQKDETKQKTKKSIKTNTNTTTNPSDGTEDNIVLGPASITGNEINTCDQIIKSGTNKGKLCGCKVYQDNKCKRHTTKVTDNDDTKITIS
jgi:hypothetical protein